MQQNNQLYYVSMTAGGSSNILLEMFANRNKKIKFKSACECILFPWKDHYVPFNNGLCEYVTKVNTDLGVPFRTVDWTKHFSYLEQLVADAAPESLWIGNNVDHTIAGVKKRFGDNVTTISINYTESDYNFLYERWVKWQIGYLLKRQSKQFESYSAADRFCREAGPEYFGYTIPLRKDTIADVVINYCDIFDSNKIYKLMTDIGWIGNHSDWEFYYKYMKHC